MPPKSRLPTARTTRTTARAKAQSNNITPDELATKLATKLTISDTKTKGKGKGKGKAMTPPPEECRASAMRVVNAASKGLSSLIDSGWKANIERATPGEVDVERAHSSIVGKLITLEMHNLAMEMLGDMHLSLVVLYQPGYQHPADLPTHLLLTLPLHDGPISDIVLNLISTYLLQALTVLCNTTDVSAFVTTLFDYNTLLQWAPRLSQLTEKQHGSIFTRAYAVLARYASADISPCAAYRIRIYALLCLAHTRSSVILPGTFWDQAVKFASIFATSIAEDCEDNARQVMCLCAQLVSCTQQRVDHVEFMTGIPFVRFCEYWSTFAKQIGDLTVLDDIAALIRIAGRSIGNRESARERSALESATTCTTLTQALAALEKWSDASIPRLRDAVSAIQNCKPFLMADDADDADERRCADKVRRALERLRRAAVKVVDPPSSNPHPPMESQKSAKTVLEKIANILVDVITEHICSIDMLTPALEISFVLARTTFSIRNPETYDASYSLLSRAATLLSTVAEQSAIEGALASHANYVRCVSGAYHHIAGLLYQGARYSHAVRFLNESCFLGTRALEMYRRAQDQAQAENGKEEVWKQLEEQLYRRWEILGLAYDAFIECIRSYPFFEHSFVQVLRTSPPPDTSIAMKQIGNIVDRVTYMGVCELFRDPQELSAKAWFAASSLADEKTAQMQKCIVGALLERQLDGLESSKWKPAVRNVLLALLRDALTIYLPEERPIRRARVLLRYLELEYHTPPDAKASSVSLYRSAAEAGQEINILLAREDAHYDRELVRFRTQYTAILHLWLALHAHRQGQGNDSTVIIEHAATACKIVRSALLASPRQSLPKTASPKATAPAKKRIARTTSSSRSAATKSRGSKASKIAVPVTPKPRKPLDALPLNTALITPPKNPANISTLAFDDFDKFIALLRTTSQLIGLLGHVLARVQILNITRRLCERHMGVKSDAYVLSTIEVAHEYVNLGRAEKAASIYNQVLNVVRSGAITQEIVVMFLLRYAESLAAVGEILKASTVYCEAFGMSAELTLEEKGLPTAQKIRLRAAVLERAAGAALSYAAIQHSRDDPTAAINGLLQSLRLWNRAIDTISRLYPAPAGKEMEMDNPFDIGHSNNAQVGTSNQVAPVEAVLPRKTFGPKSSLDASEWRLAEGLLATLFTLAHAYAARGSARESEYFVQQAKEFAQSLNAPAMISRALARHGELSIQLGNLEDGYNSLMQAARFVANLAGPDAAEVRRLQGLYNQLSADCKGAHQLFEEATNLLDELGNMFSVMDGATNGARKSLGLSPRSKNIQTSQNAFSPTLLARILRQHISLLHDAGEEYEQLLERFAALPPTAEAKAEENALRARLTLDDVYSRFRADMFLSSLAESAMTIPMGMSGEDASSSPASQEILGTLMAAEKLFWSDLSFIARRGHVSAVRDAAMSVALIRTLHTSLGRGDEETPILAAQILDAATAITLRREMLDVIRHKFLDMNSLDDLRWPSITANGSPLALTEPRTRLHFNSFHSNDEDDATLDDPALKQYWTAVYQRYEAQSFDASSLSTSRADLLPSSWTVINVSVTEDQSTMTAGDPDDEHLTFEDALKELQEIIRLSDEGTRKAADVRKDDKAARTSWWTERITLDKRLQDLLANIEFCWLGAFKTIFSQPVNLLPEELAALRSRLNNIFMGSLIFRGKKPKSRRIHCREEEIEDLVYFILDLYQFHGIPVATSEVDMDHIIIEIKAALEEHRARLKRRGDAENDDNHIFLILDKNVQGLPWESIPMLRGRSVSRIPSMEFLSDRIKFARWQDQHVAERHQPPDRKPIDRAVVDPRRTYYILNPSGDLKGTEGRFAAWVRGMKNVGWKGVIGRPPSEQQFTDALSRQDLVVYFGHGGAEQYIRSHKIRHLPRCAATMLWGCSSGALKEMGEFDRVGTPHNYMLAGCPTLIANLWDVTDRDIDKFSQAVFDKLRLTPEHQSQKQERPAN
ncbi:hypothetical protein A0H81_02757 [Grifola frondosa]|uniref:separase n=1 Tax=Grifola frondosa TaxID=5627 RepID=A0A1C7MMI2_GRIFR|nr:hypothetical protein A0H81_02757 [Grifola frondosa]